MREESHLWADVWGMGYAMWPPMFMGAPGTRVGALTPYPKWGEGVIFTGVPTTGCPIVVPPLYMLIPPEPGACEGCLLDLPEEVPPPALVAALVFVWPVMGPSGADISPLPTLVMSWMLDLLLSLFIELRRMKYFWAWLATCVGVLVITKFRDMLRQSPFPYFSKPCRNNLFHILE